MTRFFLITTFLFTSFLCFAQKTLVTTSTSKSFYTAKPDDPEAIYFTPENFGFNADGKDDVSEALQKAINQVKTQYNFGIVFIPEGKYLISKTIYVPQAVRLIGYGKKKPSDRRRDSGDFNKVSTNRFSHYFIAPDAVTVIPVVYDLARSNSLIEAFPGKPLFATDEYLKRTVRFNVGSEGYLSDPKIFAEKDEFSSTTDSDGNVYVADGQIYGYNSEGKQIGEIELPERPSTIVFSRD
ncbi:MAG: glycosyl hydrolase family 28-related protein [Bacteroidota bacterium]